MKHRTLLVDSLDSALLVGQIGLGKPSSPYRGSR